MKFSVIVITIIITLSCFVTIAAASDPQWHISTVDSTGDVGRYTSLALDGTGNPRISYYNYVFNDGNLKYAKWTGTAWEISTVDSGGDVGQYCSLKLDGTRNPHISYYNFTGGNLKYAKWTGTAWEISTVDSAWNVGSYTSLALDGSGNPHISYYNQTLTGNPKLQGDLKYAKWTGSAWEISTVDTGGVGLYISLALDGAGNPRISYYDYGQGFLKYAKWNGSEWNISTVDTIDDVGRYSSLKLDGSGNPRISYYDATGGGNLNYAEWNGSSWHIKIVDSYGLVGSDTSLALDGAGNPRISYYNLTDGSLKYAKRTGTTWENSTIDSGGDVGLYTSLALDRSGNPRISYFDKTNMTLKYAEFVAAQTRIGVFRNSTKRFLLDYNGNGAWDGASIDRQYNFGISGDIPVTGDWNDDGKSEIGVFRNSTHTFYLDYNANGVWNVPPADRQYNFGLSGDLPISGDWNNDRKSEIGVFRPSTHLFYLDYNGNGVWNVPPADRQYNFDISGDIPVTGDWNNNGISEIGIYRNSTKLFYLDYNGNGVWNGSVIDRQYNFGISGDTPVSGKWS